jgi:hypothetical protein
MTTETQYAKALSQHHISARPQILWNIKASKKPHDEIVIMAKAEEFNVCENSSAIGMS